MPGLRSSRGGKDSMADASRAETCASDEGGGCMNRHWHLLGHPEHGQAPVHPALQRTQEQRSSSIQARVSDAITAFAGSMPFVYLHIVWFAIWILFRVEKF